MVRVADYVAQKIYDIGSKYVFTVTGRGALFLTDGIAAHKNLKSVSMHHEQAAAYAAVSYSQYTNNIGTCIVSTGCASTNAITGVLNAWQDGIPCLFISGQNKLAETTRFTGLKIRTYGQQEADLIPMVDSITKYSTMIVDPERIVYEMEKAIYLARSGRKGPVWIDIPLDVQNMRINPDTLEHFKPENSHHKGSTDKDVSFVINSLKKSKRPVILIGSGVHSADAIEELNNFQEKFGIPLTYAASATDTYGLNNDLSIGSVGIMGCTRAGSFAVQNSDFLLVLGSRLSSMTVGETCKFAREAAVVVIDIDPVEHSKGSVNIDRFINSDVKDFLINMNNEEAVPTNSQWVEKCKHWKDVFPRCEDYRKKNEKIDLYYLSECLSHALPDKSVFLTDSGLNELILPTNISFDKGQRCIHPVSQGAMGVALPALIGAHFASDLPVVAVIGDGSIMMNLQELETIRYHQIPAKIFVVNNNVYAVIRKRQVEMFRSRTIGTDPSDGVSCPEFEKVAASFDLDYVKIETSSGLANNLKEVMNMKGPVLCEIMGLNDQDYISCGHVRNKLNQIVTRPIEDQQPYMDRELFLSEMLVDPIDQ
jgi:acetolactate synthase I/II/III large subunit